MKQSLHALGFDSERFFHVLGEGWYFEAREGMFGPYETRAVAEQSLQRLINRFPQKRPGKRGARAA